MFRASMRMEDLDDVEIRFNALYVFYHRLDVPIVRNDDRDFVSREIGVSERINRLFQVVRAFVDHINWRNPKVTRLVGLSPGANLVGIVGQTRKRQMIALLKARKHLQWVVQLFPHALAVEMWV